MANLDLTIVVIACRLFYSNYTLLWFTVFGLSPDITLMMTILLVLLGRLADLYGRVRLYNFGFAIFTVGSLLALYQNGRGIKWFSDFCKALARHCFMRTAERLLPMHFLPESWGWDWVSNVHGSEPRGYCRLYTRRGDDNLFRVAVNILA